MREASINIKFSQFLICTQDFLSPEQCKEIFRRAAKYKPARVLVKPAKVNAEKVRKVMRNCDEELFNNILSSRRLQENHRFVILHKHDPDWTTLINIAADAQEFSELYGYTAAQGYLVYINYGLHLMGKKYGLSKFSYYKNRIFDLQQEKFAITNDPDPSMTEKVYNYFIRQAGIRNNAGYKTKYLPTMVYICDAIRESGVRYDKYLELQFEYWRGFNKTPEPSWCHTREAIDRVLKIKK